MVDVPHRCCPAFDRAKQEGTDNEEYMALLWLDDGFEGDPGAIKIGSTLPPIAFCPWCGAKITQPDGSPK